jgi:hypothetical protein
MSVTRKIRCGSSNAVNKLTVTPSASVQSLLRKSGGHDWSILIELNKLVDVPVRSDNNTALVVHGGRITSDPIPTKSRSWNLTPKLLDAAIATTPSNRS